MSYKSIGLNKIIIYFLFFAVSNFISSQTLEQYKDSINFEVKKLSSDSLKASLYYDAARFTIEKLNNTKQYRVYIDSSIHYSRIANHKDLEAKNHFAYGLLERLEGNYEKALEHLDINIKYFQNDSLMKPYAMFQVGVINRKLGDYERSLDTYLDILKIFESRKDSFAIASTFNSIANVYGDLEKYDESIDNFTRAKDIFINKKVKREISNTEMNIAQMYIKKSDYLEARKHANESLKIAEEISNGHLIGSALYLIGQTYVEYDAEKGLSYFLEAEKILEKEGINNIIIALNRDLGDVYSKLGINVKAEQYYNKALIQANESKELPEIKNIYQGLAELNSKNKNFKNAYDYQLAFQKINDSILGIENLKIINLLEKKFESEKKDNEIITQKLAFEKQESQLQKKQSQYKFMTGLVIFLFLVSVLTWFLFQQRQKRKNQEIITLKREQQVKTLETLMEGEENERFRIAKELHDGVNVDLSTIKYKLTSMLEKNNEVINEAVAMIDKSCEQVRAISHNLIPPALKNFSLIEAIEDYMGTMNTIHEPEINFHYIGDPIQLSKKVEINIFRIVQELVNNSLKHANSTEINVQMSHRESLIQLTVEDDGKGFNKDATTGEGIGLRNIKSRVDYLNAKMDFDTGAKGTSYIIEINTNELS